MQCHKSRYNSSTASSDNIDISSFTNAQRQVYDIVGMHVASQQELQLRMIITGQEKVT